MEQLTFILVGRIYDFANSSSGSICWQISNRPDHRANLVQSKGDNQKTGADATG